MDENDIKAAKQQQWESAAAVISKEREKNDSILNRDVKALHSQKALNQLGYNPSDEKVPLNYSILLGISPKRASLLLASVTVTVTLILFCSSRRTLV